MKTETTQAPPPKKTRNWRRFLIKSAAILAIGAIAMPPLIRWWWEPSWDPTPRQQNGVTVFEPYSTIHPAHYELGEMVSILTKVDFKYTAMMVMKDVSRFFSDENASFDSGNDRLDSYYKNFEGNFDTVASIGSIAPDFELMTTDGSTFKLSDHRGRPVAFMFVAITCPPAVMQRDAWAALEQKYADSDAEILMVYSIEQHPGEAGYPDFSHPQNFQEKMSYAKLFSESTQIPVAVDSFDKDVLRKYDPLPNPAYVIDAEGRIVFKSSWADADKVDVVLSALVERQL
ncbi:MAG: redoxin domain-containing protein [Pseudomonadota bacterium]